MAQPFSYTFQFLSGGDHLTKNISLLGARFKEHFLCLRNELQKLLLIKINFKVNVIARIYPAVGFKFRNHFPWFKIDEEFFTPTS